jgi:hypothetical protein
MVLRRERLKLFEVVSETVTTVTLRSIQSVPAGKPDVQKILSIANVTVSATGTPLPNKVVIEGTATVQTIYVAALPDQPVHHMEHVISFLNSPHACQGGSDGTALAFLSAYLTRT